MSAINKINVDNVSYNIEDSRVDNIADVIPTASTEQKGLVQVGQGINVDENGVISVEASGGDSVSYTDGGTPASAVIGTLNINGTDYEIKAPWANYQDNIGDRDSHTVLGTFDNGFGVGFAINAPAVMYTDTTQGAVQLGFLTVGGDQYPITCSAASGDSVQFNSLLASGTQIGTITINGVETAIYAPAGGSGGGSTVSYQDLTIASDPRVAVGMITIDGAGYNIYVPTTVAVDWNDITGIPIDITRSLSVTPTLVSGTKIADVSWGTDEQGDVTAELYAPEQVQANWNEADSSSKAYIANKPTIPTKTSELLNDSGFARSENLALVASTGDYNDLINKPTIPTVTVTQTLASGTKIGEIDVSGTTTDIYAPAGGSSSVDWTDITNKPSISKGSDNTAVVMGNNPEAAATASYSVAEGKSLAQGSYAHAEGNDTIASGSASHSEGHATLASGYSSHAEGDNTEATSDYAHAEGFYSHASGTYSHAEGIYTLAQGNSQHAQGRYNKQDLYNTFADIIGNGTTVSNRSTAEATDWSGNKYLSGNVYVGCSDFTTTADGLQTANCGGTKVATLSDIKADWAITDASASGYIANKPSIKAGTGTGAVKIGAPTVAEGAYSVAEGYQTQASGNYSHTEGMSTQTTGMYAHAEGLQTIAAGFQSHVEGYQSTASGTASHAEGESVKAIGDYSHAEGYYSWANGQYSHAEGWNTRASSQAQHAQGKFNIEDVNGVFADIVGNGSGMAGAPRSNAEATDWSGNKYLSGGIYVGCTDYTTTANGLTTLGAGGFRIDQANTEAEVEDPTEPGTFYSEAFVMIDTITKEMGSEDQEDPDNPGETIQVPTTVTTTHQRGWVALPKEYTPRDLAVDVGILDEMEPVWSNYGTYTLQIWGVKRYANNGDGTYTEYCAPVYQWVKTADNTPRDETDPTTEEEPTE